jgi:hypothetical protein
MAADDPPRKDHKSKWVHDAADFGDGQGGEHLDQKK